MTTKKKEEFIRRQAERNDITPRQFCINQIEEWREHLQTVSEDYRALSEVEIQKRIDEEILERDSQ